MSANVALFCESCGAYFGCLDESEFVPNHAFCGECVPVDKVELPRRVETVAVAGDVL